jgi:hypothetical protein
MPWEKATVPDRTTLAGNGVDMVADSPESSILSEVALFRGLPAEQLSKVGVRLRRRTFPAEGRQASRPHRAHVDSWW